MDGQLPQGNDEQQDGGQVEGRDAPGLPPTPPQPAEPAPPPPLQHPRYLPPGQTGDLPQPPPPGTVPLGTSQQLPPRIPTQAPMPVAVLQPRQPGEVLVDGQRWEPAGCWRRLGAFLIDFVVLSLFWLVLRALLSIPEPDPAEYWPLMGRMLDEMMISGMPSDATLNAIDAYSNPVRFANWLKVLMCAGYFTIFHGMLGATLGKLVLGLRVMRRTGQRLGYGWAFLRYVAYWLVARLAYTAWLIPLNREQRTLYDMVLGTNVFKLKKEVVAPRIMQHGPPPGPAPPG